MTVEDRQFSVQRSAFSVQKPEPPPAPQASPKGRGGRRRAAGAPGGVGRALCMSIAGHRYGVIAGNGLVTRNKRCSPLPIIYALCLVIVYLSILGESLTKPCRPMCMSI
jgi:hypothetical protein